MSQESEARKAGADRWIYADMNKNRVDGDMLLVTAQVRTRSDNNWVFQWSDGCTTVEYVTDMVLFSKA